MTRGLRVGKRFVRVYYRRRCRFALGRIENLAAVEAFEIFLMLVFGDEYGSRVLARFRWHRLSRNNRRIITLPRRIEAGGRLHEQLLRCPEKRLNRNAQLTNFQKKTMDARD